MNYDFVPPVTNKAACCSFGSWKATPYSVLALTLITLNHDVDRSPTRLTGRRHADDPYQQYLFLLPQPWRQQTSIMGASRLCSSARWHRSCGGSAVARPGSDAVSALRLYGNATLLPNALFRPTLMSCDQWIVAMPQGARLHNRKSRTRDPFLAICRIDSTHVRTCKATMDKNCTCLSDCWRCFNDILILFYCTLGGVADLKLDRPICRNVTVSARRMICTRLHRTSQAFLQKPFYPLHEIWLTTGSD